MRPVKSPALGQLPRTFLLGFIVLGLLVALIVRFEPYRQAPSFAGMAEPRVASAGPAPSSPAAPLISPTSTPQPTPTPLPPTPTPIPAPVKVRDAALPQIGGASAVVIDEASGAVLYEKNAYARRAPASITKIVTAIVAIKHARLDDMVTVNYDASELVDSTVMGVNPGDRLSMEDLLYGLMLPSGNDAALAIANHVAGSEAAFAEMMNAEMAALGLRESHFVNAHGLDAKNHYTTAYDIATVARYAMRNPTFQKLAAARLHAVTVYTENGVKRYDVFNLNRLLTSYDGADGVKIGYTDDALRTIVASATRDGHRVYAAVMGSWNLWTDTPPLLDYAFKNYGWPQN